MAQIINQIEYENNQNMNQHLQNMSTSLDMRDLTSATFRLRQLKETANKLPASQQQQQQQQQPVAVGPKPTFATYIPPWKRQTSTIPTPLPNMAVLMSERAVEIRPEVPTIQQKKKTKRKNQKKPKKEKSTADVEIDDDDKRRQKIADELIAEEEAAKKTKQNKTYKSPPGAAPQADESDESDDDDDIMLPKIAVLGTPTKSLLSEQLERQRQQAIQDRENPSLTNVVDESWTSTLKPKMTSTSQKRMQYAGENIEGIVQQFNTKRKFGRIKPTNWNKTKSVFVHGSQVQHNIELHPGDIVTFNVISKPRGFEASDVILV